MEQKTIYPQSPLEELEIIAQALADLKQDEQELTDRKEVLHNRFTEIMNELGLESFPGEAGTITKCNTYRVKINEGNRIPGSLWKMVPDTKLIKKYLEDNPGVEIPGVAIEHSSYVKFSPVKEEE